MPSRIAPILFVLAAASLPAAAPQTSQAPKVGQPVSASAKASTPGVILPVEPLVTRTVCVPSAAVANMTDTPRTGVLAPLQLTLTPNVGRVTYSPKKMELVVTDYASVVDGIVRQMAALESEPVACSVEVTVVHVTDAKLASVLAKERGVQVVDAPTVVTTREALVAQGAEVVTVPKLVANTGHAAKIAVTTGASDRHGENEEESMVFQLLPTVEEATGALVVAFQMQANAVFGEVRFLRSLRVVPGQTAVFGESSVDGEAVVVFVTADLLPVATPGK